MDVKREAGIRVEMILAKIGEYGRPALIPLTDYADAETFDFLLPGSGWTFDEWQAVNQEVARQLRAEGFNVQLVKVTLPEYFDFLARCDLRNTPENRAQFAAWIIAPEPRPEPLRDGRP
jgi:hypothetical protein